MNENWQNRFMKIDLVFKALVELKFEIRWYFLLKNPAAYHQFDYYFIFSASVDYTSIPLLGRAFSRKRK